eukprot:8319268-Karenia_brevis.AAC.1
MFKEGEMVGEGDTLKSAIQASLPSYSKVGSLTLPYFARALKGWRKHSRPGKLPNLPEAMLDAVSHEFLVTGKLG